MGLGCLTVRSKGLLRVCAAGLIAVLAACGGSSSKTTSTVGGSSAPSSSPAASPSATPASLSRLHKIVLQPADLPAGWKGTPYQAVPGEAAGEAAVMRCVGMPSTASDKVAEAHSDDFNLGDAYVSSTATSYRSQRDVDADTAAWLNPRFPPCLAKSLKQQAATQGVALKSVSVKITPGSAGGPANVAATGVSTIKISEGGQQTVHYSTVAYIIGPLMEAEVEAENIGAPVPASVMAPLVATVANRAAAG
jgi:hypothetical protein